MKNKEGLGYYFTLNDDLHHPRCFSAEAMCFPFKYYYQGLHYLLKPIFEHPFTKILSTVSINYT